MLQEAEKRGIHERTVTQTSKKEQIHTAIILYIKTTRVNAKGTSTCTEKL